jgi:hypothetical protein
MRATAVLVLLAGTAHAQPPGQTQPIAAPESVMDRRWSIDASAGSLGLKAKDYDNVTFGMFELAGRFRIRPWVDVGLSFYGAGTKGPLSTGGLYVDGRYQFLAERAWNVWALLSLGVATCARDDASDDAQKGRGSIRIGAGVERRFRRFGIHAELRLIGIGENQDFDSASPTRDDAMAKNSLDGGSLTFGGTFYF